MTPTQDGSVLVWPSTKLNIAPDNGALYNTSSGKYCAEIYGTYIFHLHLYNRAAGQTGCAITKDDDGSLETLAYAEIQSGTLTSSTSTIVDLEKGVCVYVGHCFGSGFSAQSTFSGALQDSLK